MENKITVREYLDKYGQIIIKDDTKLFYSNGVNQIGGKMKASDFNKTGMI